jgi:hypothetical protein
VVAALALAASLAPGLSLVPAEDAVAAALRATPPGGARAAVASAPLLAAPYLASPLGEGGGRDPDPRFRLDAFDCMTFVETAVALGSASTLEQAALAMDDLRYDGAPALGARNHEVLSQWIPHNLAHGWIAQATREIAGPLARAAEKTYTPESWARVRDAGRSIPGLPRARLPVGRFEVEIVAPADVAAIAGRIPDGAIAFVVRADAPDRATRVTHAGLVVRDARGAVRVRHATSSRGVGRLIEEPIARFLRRESQAFPRWPLEGVAFFTIRDNTARIRSLAAAGVAAAATAPGERPTPALPPRL